MDQKTEIRCYIKCRIRLNVDSKQTFNELCGIYGAQTISMRTVFRWVKAFKAGKLSIEDGYLICSLRSKIHNALNMLRNF